MTIAPNLSLTNDMAGTAEGNSGSTPFTFTVTRRGDLTGVSQVHYGYFQDGTVTTDALDFAGGVFPSGSVTFAAGQSTATITVNVAGDTVFEANEKFTIGLYGAIGAVIDPSQTFASTLIYNDDQPASLSISANQAGAYEGNTGSTPFTFTVTRSFDQSIPVYVDYALNLFTGANSLDFVGNTAGTVSFAAGQSTATITMQVAGDSVIEPNERFAVMLSNARGPSVAQSIGITIGNAFAFSTILNDDPSTLAITAGQAALREGDAGPSIFTFTVTRVGDLTGTAQASYAVSGSAAAEDFVGGVLPSGIVTFAAGAATAEITIQVAGDRAFEPDDGFAVTLSSPVNTVIRQATASSVILNDDAAATLAVDTGNPLDGVTSNPALVGIAQAGSAITLSDGDRVLGTVTADAAGAWSFVPVLADGVYALTVSQLDLAGRTSAGTVALTLDTVAPVVTAALAADTGAPADGLTNNATLSGTAEANSVVTVSNGAIVLGTASTDAAGAWVFVPGLADGSVTLTVSQTALAGNTGATVVALTLDSAAPLVSMALAYDTGKPGDAVTSDAALVGTAEANSVVTVRSGAVVLGTVATDAAGSWSFVPVLADGDTTLTAGQTDLAGNVGTATLVLTLDTTAPVVVAGLLADTGAPGDGLTNNATLAGTAEANSLVTISNGAIVLGSAATDAVGGWSFVPGLADGGATLTVSQTDLAGNLGSTDVTLILDTVAPVVTGGLVADTGQPGDGVTSNAALVGTAEANSVVTFSNGGVFLGAALANAAGAWSFLPLLVDGDYSLTASQTDLAGNIGSARFALTLDTKAPVVGVALASDTGNPSDGVTRDATIAGTAEANSLVTLSNGAIVLGTAATDAAGAWSFVPTLADGSYTLTASQTDLAGNTGSATVALTLDTKPPSVVMALAADTGMPADQVTSNAALVGTAEADSFVTLSNGGIVLGSVATDAAGVWRFVPALADGSYNLTASQTDLAGNVGSSNLALTLDTKAPSVAMALVSDTGKPADGVTSNAGLAGTAEANSFVTLSNGATVLGTAATDATGAWSFAPALADGSYVLTASQTDLAGNTGSANVALTLDTKAPVVIAALAADTGRPGDGVTNNAALAGTAEANSFVTLSNGGTVIGTAATDAAGAWSFVPTLADGVYTMTATQADLAGNIGSAAVAVTLDTKAPVVSITSLGGLTRHMIQTLTGTGEAGTAIAIKDGSVTLGTTRVGTNGAWSLDVALIGTGAHSLVADDTDLAGNVGSSGAVLYTLDATPPKTVITDVVQVATKTASHTTIRGTTEAGSVVTLFDTGGTSALATITADVVTGKWSFLTSSLPDVVHDFTATAVDAAGNIGPVSNHAFFGSTKNDALRGISGDTLLIGSEGKDSLVGGTGANIFAFHPSFGKDTVGNFDPTKDLLAFDRTLVPGTVASDAALASFALSHTTEIAGTSVIVFDALNVVVLSGVAKASLVARDFHLIG